MFEPISQLFRSLGIGTPEVRPYVCLNGQKTEADSIQIDMAEDRSNVRIELAYRNVLADRIYLRFRGSEILCHRELKNISGESQKVDELAFEIGGLRFGGKNRDDFFYHAENPRIYEIMTFPLDYNRTAKDAQDSNFDIQAGTRWLEPGVVCDRIGRSPYQPFPALLLSNYATKTGLVHGSLSQRFCYHNYLATHRNGSVCLEIFSSFKSLQYLELVPGRIITDDWYLGTTSHADDVERIFEGYTAKLREVLPVRYGSSDLNRNNMVWGSWNDGIFRNITEEMILTEAAFLKKNFPTVRWIQVDDGYQTITVHAHGLGVPYEGAKGIDAKKFPHGMRHYTDALKKIGLRPAIWVGGFCPKQTPIHQEHPEWFIDYARDEGSAPLDVSRQDARDYMTGALDTIFSDWGFEAVKHDFWSYAFEDSSDLLLNKQHSGYEWRSWWLKEIRARIAADGYFQTGCDIVMGNPFLGEYFTNYRYGIDIGSGNWENVKTNFLWGTACFATHTGDMFVPNSDSVGLFPGLNDTEAMFCINYCLTTHSMVEIAGKLSQAPDSPRLPILKKAVCNPNNGQEIWFAGYDYRDQKHKTPDIIYFKTGHFCPKTDQPGLPLRTVGLFNLEDTEKTVSFSPADLHLPDGSCVLTDVWSGESIPFSGEVGIALPAHGSRLLAVSETDGLQLLDADVRILASSRTATEIMLETDYEADAVLTLNRTIGKAMFDGMVLDAEIHGNTVLLHVPGKGRLTLSER